MEKIDKRKFRFWLISQIVTSGTDRRAANQAYLQIRNHPRLRVLHRTYLNYQQCKIIKLGILETLHDGIAPLIAESRNRSLQDITYLQLMAKITVQRLTTNIPNFETR